MLAEAGGRIDAVDICLPHHLHAAAILDKLFLRRDLGLATPKQVRWLRKFDHPHPELATFTEASAFLDQRWGKRHEPAAA